MEKKKNKKKYLEILKCSNVYIYVKVLQISRTDIDGAIDSAIVAWMNQKKTQCSALQICIYLAVSPKKRNSYRATSFRTGWFRGIHGVVRRLSRYPTTHKPNGQRTATRCLGWEGTAGCSLFGTGFLFQRDQRRNGVGAPFFARPILSLGR